MGSLPSQWRLMCLASFHQDTWQNNSRCQRASCMHSRQARVHALHTGEPGWSPRSPATRIPCTARRSLQTPNQELQVPNPKLFTKTNLDSYYFTPCDLFLFSGFWAIPGTDTQALLLARCSGLLLGVLRGPQVGIKTGHVCAKQTPCLLYYLSNTALCAFLVIIVSMINLLF